MKTIKTFVEFDAKSCENSLSYPKPKKLFIIGNQIIFSIHYLGWTLALDGIRWLRSKLLALHGMAPQLELLNNDGGQSYLRMTKSAFDQLRMNYVALHDKKLLTFVDPPTLEGGATLKTMPFGNVAWKHHLGAYIDLLMQNHELKHELQDTVKN